MPQDANFRFNPFTGQVVSQPIAGEPQTVRFLPEWGIYGFITNEVPTIQSGANTLNIFESPGGTQWTEIDSSLDPSPTEYRVDRKFRTGLVEFNPADDGRSFTVSYSGEGTVLSVKNFREMILEQVMTPGGVARAGLMEDGTPFYRRIFRGTNGGPIHTINIAPYSSQRKFVAINQGWYIGGEVHLVSGNSAYNNILINDNWLYLAPASGGNEWFVTVDFTL